MAKRDYDRKVRLAGQYGKLAHKVEAINDLVDAGMNEWLEEEIKEKMSEVLETELANGLVPIMRRFLEIYDEG